jgi:hypothetical protein
MRTVRIATWCSLLSLAAATPAFAAGRVDEFLGVKNWHGTLTITGNGSGSTSGGIFSDVWQYGLTSKISFTLDTYNANIQGWQGSYAGTSNINASDKATFSNCIQTSTQAYQGTVPSNSPFTLRLQGDNQYLFYPAGYDVQGASSAVSLDCAPGTQGGTGPAAWSPVLGIGNLILDLPPAGFSLKGSATVKMNSPIQPSSLVFGGTAAVIDVTVTWDIEPGVDTPPELVILKTSALQNWRPTAGNGGSAGQSIDLTAKLQATGGGSTNVVAAYFVWELTKSSKEPGYAMNAPVANPGNDFDLKLEGSDLILTDPNAQKGETKPGEYTQTTVTVTPYDWVAFGTVEVTAYLPDGSTLVGHLDGDTAQENVRLPLRSEQSLIADIWKQNSGVTGLADVTDNETDPVGDGHPGDGLSLYEEYRGFIIGGQHVEGNPKKKDYFILNTAGAFYMGGIRMFQNLSGLNVHYQLRDGEMAPDRVMNRNHNEGAHNVDQHGVIVKAIAANAGYAEAIGGPGTPGMISVVVAPRILPGAGTDIPYDQSTLAHELLHTCNVYHHGDAPSPYTWITRTADDRLLSSITNNAAGNATTVLTEQETSAAFMFPVGVPTKVIIGVANDPHTGDDNCVMRYDNARGHIKTGTAKRPLLHPPGRRRLQHLHLWRGHRHQWPRLAAAGPLWRRRFRARHLPHPNSGERWRCGAQEVTPCSAHGFYAFSCSPHLCTRNRRPHRNWYSMSMPRPMPPSPAAGRC